MKASTDMCSFLVIFFILTLAFSLASAGILKGNIAISMDAYAKKSKGPSGGSSGSSDGAGGSSDKGGDNSGSSSDNGGIAGGDNGPTIKEPTPTQPTPSPPQSTQPPISIPVDPCNAKPRLP